MSGWFDVSKAGLKQLVADRKKSFALFELYQNAWDTNTRRVDATLTRIEAARGKVRLVVADEDPDGFADLTHAYTMYAPSEKKRDPEKRGLFNVGEKLVLALCDEASVSSTTGSVSFTKDGQRRKQRRGRTSAGSRFEGMLEMTADELELVNREVLTLLPPAGVVTTFNQVIVPRPVLASVHATLPTIVADSQGTPRRRLRRARIDILEPRDGETATIYEMGIPVVETGDRFHVNVHQKIPQNPDRDNVSPSYLRQLRAEVLNATHTLLIGEGDAAASWVQSASEDERVSSEAVVTIVRARFGAKALAYDPSDIEANYNAVAAGYAVVHGGSFSSTQWERIRNAEALAPAGRVFPTPRAYGDGPGVAKVIAAADYTPGMHDVVRLTEALANELLGRTIIVRIVDTPNRFTDHTWTAVSTLICAISKRRGSICGRIYVKSCRSRFTNSRISGRAIISTRRSIRRSRRSVERLQR